MHSLIFLAIVGLALSVPLPTEVTKNENLPEQYVLPGESRPTLYDVQLFLNPENADYFNGTVSIRVLPNRQTQELVLHAMEITIFSIQVLTSNNVDVFSSYILATDDTHLLRIQLNREINPQTVHTVNIQYSGKYADNMFGIYVSTYPNEATGEVDRLITSQLQPTFARRAFPCYDEPSLKAVFRTTIYSPPQYSVVRSNMPERTVNETLKPEIQGWTKHEFQDTLVMSSYLIAYLVSNFVNISNENNKIFDVDFNVYSRPGTQDFARYALEFGQRNMVALEEYTEFRYEFPKMDKAAVPDFAAGAMENWGLVIYREVALLVQEGVTTTQIRQSVASIICHENMHQWFGNEVSPLSWTFTWLNEGFANFFQSFATELVLPEYRMMDQYVLQLQSVMQNDAVLGVNPMTHPVYTPSEIIGTFNAVAYQKSGSVIRMMQHFLTPEVFRRGLVIYLRNNARSAVGPSNLFAAMQQALVESDHSVPWSLVTILERWTTQGGFPVLTVRRSASTAQSVFVSQERFLTDATQSAPERWHVPVNWVLSTNTADFEDTKPQSWIGIGTTATAVDIPGLSDAEWYIFNKQQTGYYRVNYDVENWAALAKVLEESHELIHLLNRAQIIDDSFNLARNGRLDYRYALDISKYLVKEKDYIPWASANTALNYLDIVLSGSEVYEYFQNYMFDLSAPLFKELGFDAAPGEEHVTAYHRNNILNINCRYGKQECVSRAQELLQTFVNNPSNRLNPDIQTTVFCSGLRGGDVDNFNFLWNQYLSTTDSSEQSIYLNALGCTSNEELLDFYLNQVINDESPVREQDRHTIIVAIINASPENMDKALDFVVDNFHLIQTRVQGLSGTTNILSAFARRLNTEEHGEKLDELERRHGNIFTASEIAGVGAIRENIAASISWSQNNMATVDAWLRENYGNDNQTDGAATTYASILLLISSFMIAVYHYEY